jgi:hypothetical protein
MKLEKIRQLGEYLHKKSPPRKEKSATPDQPLLNLGLDGGEGQLHAHATPAPEIEPLEPTVQEAR